MQTTLLLTTVVLAGCCLVGACQDAPRPVSSPTTTPSGSYGAAPQATPATGGQPPTVEANTTPKYGDPVTDENFVKLLKPETAALVEKVRKLQAAYDAAPQDAALKRQLVAAKVEYGNALRDLGQAGPRIYYPAALRMYRQVLALDAGHKEAAEKKKEIELIYQSMGRPIPE